MRDEGEPHQGRKLVPSQTPKLCPGSQATVDCQREKHDKERRIKALSQLSALRPYK